MRSTLEREIAALARQIAELGADEKTKVYNLSWWSDRMLSWAMARPSFKTELFRFVDVFPATTDRSDVVRHLREYFQGSDVPKPLGWSVAVADNAPLGEVVAASIARRNIIHMAEQFIVGSDPVDAVAGLKKLWDQGSSFTVDLLGEKTVTDAEADDYATRLDLLVRTLVEAAPTWQENLLLELDDFGKLPRANVSVKPTALSAHYSPLTREQGIAEAKARLLPICKMAAEQGAFVWFDMEHYDVKDITLQLFRELLQEPALKSLHAGVVIQAYLKDSQDDLAELIAWSSKRSVPVGARLVKGAYWDQETIQARANGWPSPVYEHKAETDANYERCVRLMHDHHGQIRAAFGSHNLRSLAYAIAYARHKSIPDNGYELQMLYGMAEPVHAAIRRMGLRLRVYAPVGELVPGMAYLVRRLLENTSNESFVRLRFAEGKELDNLIKPPGVDRIPDPPAPTPRRATDPNDPSPYDPEPVAEWRRASVRSSFAQALERLQNQKTLDVPARINDKAVKTTSTIESVDPSDPTRVVAVSASCTSVEADNAIEAALSAWPKWRSTPARDRAAVLFRAAEWMRSHKNEVSALEVLEAGKPWAEADADVCEAIDFCEYYGREMIRLDNGGEVQSPPGESNRLQYQARGLGVVIAPWNFPLAIPVGMVTAALVTGNCVLFKPAEQTPAIAEKLVDALREAGLPKGVLAFLPGIGEDVGAYLVAHPEVAFITFTGSKEVGLSINQTAATHSEGQRHVKRVIAEMGGKNAVIVDSDSDLDQAVPAVLQSAFGFSGQKCSALSRLIVVEDVYDDFMNRLVGATGDLNVGDPKEMSTQLGPVIDADSHQRLRQAIAEAPAQGDVMVSRSDTPSSGYFVGPTVVAPSSTEVPLAKDELFGPVLSVFKAKDFDEAIQLANDSDYALTAGVISRSPAHIRKASEELRAGNVYINRGITGAVVGRQPFGGFGLSGVGSKAGGPDYLLQFMEPKVITENTLRQGFAPPSD